MVGELPEAVPTLDYLREAGRRLRVGALRHSRIVHERVRRVAVCTGAGGSLLGEALRAGAELYLTADLKYNDFMAPSGRLTVADIGHFESEYCAIEILFEIFRKFAYLACRQEPLLLQSVNYLVYDVFGGARAGLLAGCGQAERTQKRSSIIKYDIWQHRRKQPKSITPCRRKFWHSTSCRKSIRRSTKSTKSKASFRWRYRIWKRVGRSESPVSSISTARSRS